MALRRHLMVSVTALAVGTMVTGPASAQPMLSDQDRAYLVASHQGHLAEILSGTRAAVTMQGNCAPVRQIGQLLMADHTRLDAMGAAVALPNAVMLPLTPNAEQTQQLLATGMKTGQDFDRSWLLMQKDLHQQALAAGAQQLATGYSEQVTALARDAEPTISHHLDLINEALTRC
ncbi:DUF4142 domain-containing protein [Nocardia asiatica]|uniref:DUF4142 domain-containing protein n=1 Tax=Nocardia asiatica TaxID=209252 RepID=UPI002456C5B1|nr:DUF4142 domain-containing protein [Nocardia asiatica]